MDKKKDKKKKFSLTPSIESYDMQPENCDDMINTFGTYNVQKTNASDNIFPSIEQHE